MAEISRGDEMKNELYTIGPTNIEQIGRYGHECIGVKVRGYSSYNIIEIRITRDWKTGAWKADVTHSSGGRNTDEEPDSLISEAYFGQALIAAAEYGRMLESKAAELEQWYQLEHAERDAEEARQKAAKDARIEADAPLGPDRARMILNAAINTAAERMVATNILIIPRGENTGHTVAVHHNPFANRTTFKWWGTGGPISKKNLLETLAAASHRSSIREKEES